MKTMKGSCMKCGRKCQIRTAGQCYCRQCFAGIIDRRLRKSIKGKLERGERVLVVGGLARAAMARVINFPLETIFREPGDFGCANLAELLSSGKLSKLAEKEKATKIVLPWTADMEAHRLLSEFFHNRREISGKKYVRLFKDASNEELGHYAAAIGAKAPCFPADELNGFISKLEARYPGTALSLARSSESLTGLRGMARANGQEKSEGSKGRGKRKSKLGKGKGRS